MLDVFTSVASVWAWLLAGGLVGVALLAAGFYMFTLRQLFFGLALGAFGATIYAGYMVKLEHDVCEAKQEQAEAERVQRDVEQGQIAAKDEIARQTQIDALEKKLKDVDNAYAKTRKAIRKAGGCRLTPADLP